MTAPLTTFIVFLLRDRPSRADAGAEARRLGLRIDLARWYFETVGR